MTAITRKGQRYSSEIVIKDLARHRGDAGHACFPVAGGGQPLRRDLYPRRLKAADERLAAAGRAGHLLSRQLEWKLKPCNLSDYLTQIA